ncbi:hypothetical protein ACP70R_005020 [Stipagrostis hirtigluma subsp. patula]
MDLMDHVMLPSQVMTRLHLSYGPQNMLFVFRSVYDNAYFAYAVASIMERILNHSRFFMTSDHLIDCLVIVESYADAELIGNQAWQFHQELIGVNRVTVLSPLNEEDDPTFQGEVLIVL